MRAFASKVAWFFAVAVALFLGMVVAVALSDLLAAIASPTHFPRLRARIIWRSVAGLGTGGLIAACLRKFGTKSALAAIVVSLAIVVSVLPLKPEPMLAMAILLCIGSIGALAAICTGDVRVKFRPRFTVRGLVLAIAAIAVSLSVAVRWKQARSEFLTMDGHQIDIEEEYAGNAPIALRLLGVPGVYGVGFDPRKSWIREPIESNDWLVKAQALFPEAGAFGPPLPAAQPMRPQSPK